MKNLRNYWEDQLALYQKKLGKCRVISRVPEAKRIVFLLILENNDEAGCKVVLKAVIEEMEKEENLELFQGPEKKTEISSFEELQFPKPPNAGLYRKKTFKTKPQFFFDSCHYSTGS